MQSENFEHSKECLHRDTVTTAIRMQKDSYEF